MVMSHQRKPPKKKETKHTHWGSFKIIKFAFFIVTSLQNQNLQERIRGNTKTILQITQNTLITFYPSHAKSPGLPIIRLQSKPSQPFRHHTVWTRQTFTVPESPDCCLGDDLQYCYTPYAGCCRSISYSNTREKLCRADHADHHVDHCWDTPLRPLFRRHYECAQ